MKNTLPLLFFCTSTTIVALACNNILKCWFVTLCNLQRKVFCNLQDICIKECRPISFENFLRYTFLHRKWLKLLSLKMTPLLYFEYSWILNNRPRNLLIPSRISFYLSSVVNLIEILSQSNISNSKPVISEVFFKLFVGVISFFH